MVVWIYEVKGGVGIIPRFLAEITKWMEVSFIEMRQVGEERNCNGERAPRVLF